MKNDFLRKLETFTFAFQPRKGQGVTKAELLQNFFQHMEVMPGLEDLEALGYDADDQPCYYRLDPDSAQWPINEIDDNLYAAKGPEEEPFVTSIEAEGAKWFQIEDFLYEVLNYNEHRGNTDIEYIVALGIPGVDFPDYFSKKTEYSFTPDFLDEDDDKDKKYAYELEPIQVDKSASDFAIYTLNCKVFDEEHILISQKHIRVLSVPIADGKPIKFNDASLVKFYDILLNALSNNKGVVVHCQAGLGRTGQVICAVKALLDFKQMLTEEYGLDDDNSDNAIQDYEAIVTAIGVLLDIVRARRPGLVLTPQQLFEFICHYVRYMRIKNPLDINDENENNSQISQPQHVDKRSKIERQTSTTTNTSTTASTSETYQAKPKIKFFSSSVRAEEERRANGLTPSSTLNP